MALLGRETLAVPPEIFFSDIRILVLRDFACTRQSGPGRTRQLPQPQERSASRPSENLGRLHAPGRARG